MDFRDAEGIDWDNEDDEEGNLVHCLRHGVTESVVDQVLRNDPSLVKTRLKTATFAVLGRTTKECSGFCISIGHIIEGTGCGP